ncbi:MFS transporter [Streptomyces sp. NPDC006460]|uniref:MFS transporter n=1 Tax=Streptomyces sp. NPDC006460 TaxID=3154304 RepID=UPI0033A918BE
MADVNILTRLEAEMSSLSTSRRRLVLATVCLAALAITLDTTIINVALPELSRQLSASTRELQWIVDAYNLSFASLVLTAGSVGDRFGRRPTLLAGLAGFALTSLVGGLVDSADALIAMRFLMGASAAVIFPTTLSIITNTFPERRERAQAIGIWGAVTGLGVAIGPIVGGVLLAHFSWPSVFFALVPVAAVAFLAALIWVPESSRRSQARIDIPGLILSTAAIGLLVYTIIESSESGWSDPARIAGFAASALLAVVFVAVERHRTAPMIDVTLFRTPAFSAASGSVTVAFFSLFGFIFLVTQYFQLIRGHGTLSTGVRILPVAVTIAIGSLLGATLAVRVGTRATVMTGLTLLASSFGWIAVSPADMSYSVIVGQMVLMGLGLGLTTAPATDSILSVLPPAKAGIGSAVNDATRETGGTLGVAVLGSIFTSLYAGHLPDTAFGLLPGPALHSAQESVAAALATAQRAPASDRAQLLDAVRDSFMTGFHLSCVVAAGICLLGVWGAAFLPGRPSRTGVEAEGIRAAAPARR